MKSLYSLAIAAMMLPATAANAQTASPGDNAVISYTSLDGLFREFAADRTGDGVYLRDRRNNWYFAAFDSRCDSLLQSGVIAFRKDADQQIAPGSVVVVPNTGGTDECRISELTHSAPPPDSLRHRVAVRYTRGLGSLGFTGPAPVGITDGRPDARATLH